MMLMLLVGLPAYALGHVAGRERRARGEVERLNVEVSGTLTRLQAAQEKLVEAERMATVGRLSLKVAHEVRNPIAAIELNAELLGDIVQDRPGAQTEEAMGLVGSIREQVSALDALTEEYLAFARFPKAQFEEDSVNDMVRAVTEFVRPLAGRQGITVSVTTDDTIPPMEIDRSLLRQAVLNLIKNGLEAAVAGRHAQRDAPGVWTTASRSSVSDTGPGIAPDVGPRLFEQFFTTKPQGTGLGLSITRQIVEEHGGTRSAGRARRERGRPSPSRCPSRGPSMPDADRAARHAARRRRRPRGARRASSARSRERATRWCWRPTVRPRSSGCARAASISSSPTSGCPA